VHISGENVTLGYFETRRPTRKAFTADKWLKTGDLGVVVDGNLYISGRAKEIIFVNGQNYYPHRSLRPLRNGSRAWSSAK